MKKLYKIFAIIFLLGSSQILIAQNCGFANTGVKYNSSSESPSGNCIINVDIFFDLHTNAGSKFLTAHIWPKLIYPALTYVNPPDATQLAGAVTLVVDHFQDHTYAYMDDKYLPDQNVQPQYIGMGITIGPSALGVDYERFTITNVNLDVPGGCAIPQVFTMDVWATESASMNTIHCKNTAKDFFANNPKVNGAMECGPPRTYSLNITTIDPTEMTVDFDVYIDNGDLTFNKAEDLPIKSSTGHVISTSSGYSSGTLTYLPYSNQVPEAHRVLWVEVKSATLPNTVIYKVVNPCTLLPVQLKTFTAQKEEATVLLKWVTSSESGNLGFYIERKSGNNEWQNIGFVSSLAKGGNSFSDIAYSFVDPFTENAIVQYRLKQTDLDGKFEYSPVRIVKNEVKNEIMIFPNPSRGDINVIFPDSQINYQVTLFSTEAKMLKNFQNAKTSLNITGLKPGIYLMKIENLRNKEVFTRKIIVQ